jgi:hypothetical protein
MEGEDFSVGGLGFSSKAMLEACKPLVKFIKRQTRDRDVVVVAGLVPTEGGGHIAMEVLVQGRKKIGANVAGGCGH